MNFFKHLILTFGVRGISLICGLATSILISRVLGPEGKGIQASIIALNTLAIQIASIGLFSANTFFVSRSPEHTPKIAANSFWISLIDGSLVAWVCYLLAVKTDLIVASHTNVDASYIAIGVAIIPVTFALLSFQHIFLGMQDYATFNYIELILRIGTFVGVTVALFLNTGIAGLFAAMVVVTILALIYSIAMLRTKSLMNVVPDTGLMKQMLGYGMRAYIANVLAIFVLRSDILIVNTLLGAQATGIYSVSVQCADLISIIPGIIATLYFPKVTALADQRDTLTPQVVRLATPVMLILCLLAGSIAWIGIPIAFGEQFRDSIIPFLFLLPGTLALSLEMIIAQDLASRNYPLSAVLLWIPICIVNIILTFALLPYIGVSGASIASSIAYVAAYVSMIWLFMRHSGCSLKELIIVQRTDVTMIRDRLFGSIQRLREGAL